jgi:hypothetical protein
VQVSITAADGKITAVSVPIYPNSNGKDQQINARALPILTQETIAVTRLWCVGGLRNGGWYSIKIKRVVGGDSGGRAYTYLTNSRATVVGVNAVGLVEVDYYANDKGEAKPACQSLRSA